MFAVLIYVLDNLSVVEFGDYTCRRLARQKDKVDYDKSALIG
jgi:hypothetical protein